MNRSNSLDLIAGFFILFMIFVHICQIFGFDNMWMYKYSIRIFGFFMPWFFFKGGMFYKDKPIKVVFLSSLRRLLVPFVVWAIIGILVQTMIAYSNGSEIIIYRILTANIIGFLYGGTVSGNLALWFLFSLFLCRLIFACEMKMHIPVDFIIISCFLVGFFCNYIGFSVPKYFANSFTGCMYYSLGYRFRDLQYRNSIFYFSIFIYFFIQLFCYTFVGIRNNVLFEGYYVVWPIFSLVGIIITNNLGEVWCSKLLDFKKNSKKQLMCLKYNRLKISDLYIYIYKFVSHSLIYIGKKSMYLYVVHWPILCLIKYFCFS